MKTITLERVRVEVRRGADPYRYYVLNDGLRTTTDPMPHTVAHTAARRMGATRTVVR